MEKLLSVSPSSYGGDSGALPYSSASSVSSIDTTKGPTPVPSLNDSVEKPPSNYSGNGDSSTSASALSLTSSIDVIEGSTVAPLLNDYADDKEEEDICRICRNPGDIENPLRFPCACRGSIKYVHQDCLLRWLSHSNARQCEVCKHDFAFSPIYAENAPTRLPFLELIAEIAKKTCHITHFFLRLSFLLSIWLLIIPFITFSICKLAFVRSFCEAQRVFTSQISMENILTDCLLGFLLTLIIPVLFQGAVCAWEETRYLREREGQNGLLIAQALFIAQIDEMLDRVENVPFCELVGLQGPLYPVIKFGFLVLVRNIYKFGIIKFAPFCLGRVIIHWLIEFTLSNTNESNDFSTEFFSDFAILGAGYLALIFLYSLYLGIVDLIRFKRGESLIIRKLHGLGSVRVTIIPSLCRHFASARENLPSLFRHFASVLINLPCLFRKFISAMRHLKIIPKVTFLMVNYLSILPIMCGRWIDFCTLDMSGNSDPERFEFFTMYSYFHWLIGLVYLILTSCFVLLLTKVLRNGARLNYNQLRGLINVPVYKHVLRVLLACPICGCLIIMLVFLPVKLAMWIKPSIFPLDINVSDSIAETLLLEIFFPFALKQFTKQIRFKFLLRYWLTIVGSSLGLTHFLLDNGAHQRQDRALARPDFVVRIVGLIILAWMTLLVINTTLIILPVSLGRAFFTLISFLPIINRINSIVFGDLYAFIIGSFQIWFLISAFSHWIELIRGDEVLRRNIRKWGVIVAKSCALLCVLYVLARGVLPVFESKSTLDISSVVYRFAWLGCLGLGLVLFYVWFTYVHNSIRDERYLIGRTLHNFGEHQLANQTPASSESG